jgi:phosphoribosylaminoimidazole-succinocarboxamide synthase
MVKVTGLPLIRQGSSKDIYDGSSIRKDHVVFHFTDYFSVLDRGRAPWPIPGLGAERAAITIRCFEHLRACAIPNHYVEQLTEDAILVKAAAIPEMNQVLSLDGRRVIPVEVLWRIEATKKFIGRYMRGEMSAERCSLKTGQVLKEGYIFDPVFVECSTKFENPDRYIDDVEVERIAGLTSVQREQLYHLTRQAAKALSVLFSLKLRVRTGKFEILQTGRGWFELGDSISPDELEFVGGYDKNILRDYYKDTFPEWIEKLDVAKERYKNQRDMWPEYPGRPTDEVMARLLSSYRYVGEVIGC